MKKRIVRSFGSKALAAVVGAAVLMQAQAPVLAGALDNTLYISEVFLSYGETDDKAKQWLKDNGYEILDQNLNEKAEGGISWLGISFSKERSVYLGYKTTTDSDQAIRDMRAMNMNGDYSYEEYQKVLENKKTEINAFIGSMKAALAEYRQNYKDGAVNAKTAHDQMNQYLDDDSNYSALGDLLLKPIKEEMSEEEYKKAEKEHLDLTTLLMQGNIDLVNSLMSYLSLALDTTDSSWLERLKKSEAISGLTDKFEEAYPSLSESKIASLIRSEYDDEAKELAQKLADLKESMKVYTESDLKADDSEDKVDAYFKEHTDISVSDWAKAGADYLVLSEIKIDDTTLADIVTGDKFDLSDPDDRAVLYPVIDAMSEGQRALLPYADIGQMLITGKLDADGWKETADEIADTLKDSEPVSVYSDVDRSVFDPDGVALTSEARKIQSATGSSYGSSLFGINTNYIKYGGIAVTAILLGAGLASIDKAIALQNAAYTAKKEAMQATELINKMEKCHKTAANDFYDDCVGVFKEIGGYEISSELKTSQAAEAIYRYVKTAKSDQISYIYEGQKVTQYRSAEDFLHDARNTNDLFDKSEAAALSAEEKVASNKALEKSRVPDGISDKFVPYKVAGTVLCIAAALFAIGTAAVEIYDIYKYYHQDYAPIPRKIVHESTDDMGRFAYSAYSCVLCNREEQGFGNDKLGAYGDMNGDVGKQWLALYTTKDKAAGDPITADIIAQKGSSKAPADKTTGIRLFGKSDTVNIVSEEYGYTDALGGLYIFSGTEKTDADEPEKTEPAASETDTSSEAAAPEESSAAAEETSAAGDTSSEAAAATEDTSSEDDTKAAGSVVGTGVMVGSCVGSAALGALICFFIARRKRTA